MDMHDDVIKWKHFPRCWPFVRGIHWSPVNSLHKGQWRGALMFSLICARINGWVNNREAGDLRRHRAHYNVIVMNMSKWQPFCSGVNVLTLFYRQTPQPDDQCGRHCNHLPAEKYLPYRRQVRLCEYTEMTIVNFNVNFFKYISGLILGLRPANERRRYSITMPRISPVYRGIFWW